MSLTLILLFILGLILLPLGADLLVRGASRLAARLGVSSLVIGLTVVAFGTSAPEMAVNVQSALSGPNGAEIAIGNVVGSNIANILLVLGLSALIIPLVVDQRLVRIEVPLMIGISVLMLVLALDGRIGRLDGLILFSGICLYTLFAILEARRESQAEGRKQTEAEADAGPGPGHLVSNLLLVVAGLILLVLGAGWLVDGAIAIARLLGVSELVIGLTIVAIGTSLPEAATSILASLRGERDIAVGNLVGSNIFNILAVLGLTGLLAPEGVPVPANALQFDIPVMLATAFACLPIFLTGMAISRWEGGLFVGYYLAYTIFLILSALQHEALGFYSDAMLAFVIPLTCLTLTITVIWELRDTGAKGKG